MNQLQLLFSNEVVLEDERVMKLDYSLTENVTETNQGYLYYGVRVAKNLGDIIETEEVAGISTSKEKVVSLITKLFQFEVTPISMVEVLDDLVTLGI